jgi:hypothetical protein
MTSMAGPRAYTDVISRHDSKIEQTITIKKNASMGAQLPEGFRKTWRARCHLGDILKSEISNSGKINHCHNYLNAKDTQENVNDL